MTDTEHSSTSSSNEEEADFYTEYFGTKLSNAFQITFFLQL